MSHEIGMSMNPFKLFVSGGFMFVVGDTNERMRSRIVLNGKSGGPNPGSDVLVILLTSMKQTLDF